MAGDRIDKLYNALKADGTSVPSRDIFRRNMLAPGKTGYNNRLQFFKAMKADGADVGNTYEDFAKSLGLHAVGTPTVNKYRKQLFDSVDPNKSRASELTHRAVNTAKRAMNNVRKPVTAKYVNKEGKPTGEEFAITPAKTVEDLDREYAQEVTKNWENELHDQMADADKDAAKISDMFKSFIGSTDEVGSVWGNMTRGGGIAGTPHSVTTNNGILENTESRQLLAASDYNRKRKELLQLEQDSRNGAFFDDHSFFRGMYDAAKDTGLLTGGASDLIDAGSLLSTKQDLDNGVHTEAGDMLMQQAVKNSDAQGQYGDNKGWMYTGGVITTNMAPFMVQIASAGFSKGMSNAIGKVVQGAASKVALGTMKKAAGFASADLAKNIGKFTGLTTKAFGKAIQYGIVGAAQANTVGLGNVANDVMNRYTGQVYQDEQGNYKFGTFDSDGNLVHEGGEDFLTALAKGDVAQTIEFATELAGGGIDAVGTALKNFVTRGGKKIVEKYSMENVSKVIDFLLNNKVSKNVRYLKAGADRTLGKVELNSIVGESLEEELGIIANTVFTGDNKISDLWDEKQQSQIWGGMLLSVGLMKGAVAPFHAYNAKQYYSYKHKLNKADANLSQLLGNEKWEELRNQIDATTNKDMPDMINKINRDVALGKNRQPVREYIQNLIIMRGYDIGNMLAAKKAVEDKGNGVSVKNMEKNQAYQQGRDAYGYDTHEIQLDQEDKQKSLAQLLGISEQQLASMNDEELDALSGRDDNIDRAIYDYQLSTARYEGVVDNARDQIDLEVQRAAQAVDMYTDKSRNTIRNATIKATGGLEDYGVYIINGNVATHDDGSIDISNSDDMILYFDPTTNTVEHADAMMFAELGSEENADEVRSQAMADAKEKAIKETTGIIDGVVEVGTQFKTVDTDGIEHTYEVLADNGDGTAMITIDGNVPTELVKGENVNVPVSFEELQKMKDDSDQQRLQAAKAQREQMEKERAEQETQVQTTQAQDSAQDSSTQPAPIEDNLDYSDIIREDGKVQMVDVSDKDGNNLFPEAKDVFYIQGNKIRTKFAYIDANGELKTQSFPTGLLKINTRGEVSVDDYKKYRNTILAAESQAMPESSMIEGNSGENRGGIEAEPIGTGAFGNIYNQFKGKVKEAFSFLMSHKSGDLLGVFHRDDVGDIDLVWGNEKMGLAHILGKHVGEGKDFETPDDAIAMIENVINSGRVFQDNENRYTLMLDGVGVGIRKSFDGERKNWVVTAVDFNRSQEEKGIVTNPTSTSHGVTESESAAALNDSDGKGINNSANGNENNESLTFEDGTPIPVDENGETDLSQTDAAHAAEWYDNNLGEDADDWLDGEIKKSKKVLEQAQNKKVTGTKPSELVASKKEKEAAIADAQAHYDSAISIRDALKERQLAKVEDTADGRKELIDKARRKFARLKNTEEWSERTGDLWNETVGKLLHRLYDATGIDVFDDTPNTVYEYVAENVGPYSLNYEGNDNSKGVQQETGLSRSDFAKLGWLAAEGKGMTIDAKVHRLWENRPSNLESADTQEIRNALISLITSGQTAFQARDYILNQRIELAESALEEQLRQEEDAAEAQRAKEEEEKKKAELEKKKAEEEKTNENRNTPELSNEQQKAKEEGEKLGFPAFDKEGEPINQNVIELANWAKEQGLEIDPTSKLNSYADLYVMCKDGFGVSTLVPDVGEDINQVFYFPDNVQGEQLLRLQEEFNVGRDLKHSADMNSELTEGAMFYDGDTAREFRDFVNEKVKEESKTIEVPEDATDENPLGLQLSEDKVPFEIEGGKSGETYNINDDEDRQRLINDNKVDDKDILDIDMPKHVHKAIKELCKKMGLKVQFLYMGARSNGWIENGTMYLALDTEKATQFVFGHEMTHAIKQKNPEAYKELVKVAMAVTTRKKFEEDLANVYQNYHGISGYNNVDDYVEEVVADNLGKFINDFDLAQKFSLRLNHPVLATILHAIQKIKSLLYGDFYKSVDALERIVEKAYVKTAKGQVTNSETGEDVSFSLRQKPEPKKKGIGYKVFVLKDGKLYPPMVANPDGAATPVGVWLDADAAPIAGESKTGRPQVKQGGKGTQGGSGMLAYRPGWHLGVVPYAIQFNRKDADGNKTLFPKNFVFAEVEYAADVDYQEEARQEGINPSGKYQHSLAGLKHLPTDGYYMYRTNPNPETDPWVITGAMKVNRILTRAEQAELVKNAGREPQQIQDGDIVTDDVVNSINQEIAAAPKFSLKVYHGSGADFTEHTKFSLRLKAAIEETETNPSDAQKESGNYKKGHIKFGGYDYTIENPKGSTRSGKDANGKEWKVTMHDTYGYIRGKFGKDGDHLDMFINDKADLDNWDGDVFVVDQVNPDGSFDEHKVMYGYDSMNDAEKAYLANYSKGWQGLGNITGASKAEFDKWLDTSNRKLKPFADYAKVKFSQAQSVSEPRYSLKDIKPIGVGAFGNIYNQFRGKSKAAIEFLKKLGSGEATAALHHHTIGDISLVWGDKKAGLDKILRKHPEVVDNLQSIIDSMEVVQESDNRVKLESPTHFAVVSKEYKGEPREQWLLTAYEKRESLENDKSMDTATSSLGGDTALSQSKGSAAKIDNSSETAKENGEKFSLKDEKTLAGVHNITEEKLLKAIKQGGLANPSVAVIDSSKQNHEDYGEISLILPSEKVAKRTGKNAGTWQGDAWTPTYPQVERQMSNKGAAKASKDVSSVPGDMYREVRRGLDRWLDGGEANSAMAYMFLSEKGVAPEPKKIQHKFGDDVYNELKSITAGDFNIYGIGKAEAQKVLDMYIDAKFDGDKDLYEEKTKAWLERNKSIVDAGNKGGMRYTIAKDNVELYDEYGFNYKSVQTFVRDVEYDHRKTGVDMNATLNDVEDYIKTNNLTDEFNTWLEGKEKEYGIKEVIFDGFTPSGNRRYVPNTLENVSKIMKKQGRNGATGISVSFQNFAASLMPSYGTLKDIRSKKGLLTSDHEDLDKFTEKWSNVFFELGMKCQPDATVTFDDYGLARLSEAAKTSAPQAYLKKEYNVDFSEEDTKRLKEMVKAIKEESPAMYFETKFERPVGFNEFSSAVVPTTASSEVKHALQNAGVRIYEYDRNKEGDRSRAFNEAINSSDNIRFSLKAMMEKPEGWKQANKKAIHIAEAIERDPKFSLKNLDGTLIKAGTYFSGGGLVEEGLKGIIDPVVAVEYDEKISGVYRNNFGQHIVTADVRDVDPKELVKQIDGEVEYFHASPVCKNYSQAKSNHAEVELDKETAASTAEFINAVKPKVVTIENVKGYKDSDAMKTITDALDANGYTWDADVYNAADYGGYTNRERLIVRAVRDGKLPEKPKKMARKSGWYEAVADIIPTLTEKKNGVAPWMDIRLKADGIDWRNIDKPLYVMGSAYADGKVPHAFADELLPTLRTKSGDVIVMPDGKVYRAMGRVLARVSGVSDDYKMPFSENLSHTIIGNGIPTQLTEHVIAPLLTGSDPKFSIRTYHGTGAKFDKFDLSHALEGEGSETFGHGVYVTNSKEIGTDYAQRAKDKKAIFGFEFVNPQSMSKEAQDMLRHYMYKHQDVAKGLENARKDLKDVIGKFPDTDYLQELNEILAKDDDSIAIPSNRAYRYDVDIPDDNGSNYLGWNESQNFPLEKWYRLWEITHEGFNENEYFKDGGARYDIDRIERITQMKLESPENGMQKLPTLKGEELYHALEDFFNRERPSYGAELASRALSEIGFVGIKYPAGMIHGGAKEGDYNYVIFDENNANIVGNTRFSLRGSTPYDKQMEEWKEKNHLEKGAVPMEKPVMEEGENIFDYANRMVEWTRNQNLWKTAPKQTGFQDALDKWKADNGLSPDAYPPFRPHRENYSTEIGYTEDLEEYNKKKELWKSAPKPKDFDLSVDLEDMNKQLRNIRRAVLNQKNYDQRTVKAVSDLVRKMLNIGWGDGLSRSKVGNLLSAAKNATGANDVKKYLDKAMGILAENYLNRLSTAYDNLINTKGARADQSGVIKMGSLDANGQAFMSEYKKAINMDDSSLNTYIANIEEDSAKNEDNVEMNDYRLAGIQAAIMFKQQIGGNDADIAELQRQIGELKNKKDATKEDKDLLKSLEKKLFENKFDRITMYENLLNNIQRMVKESKGRAKEFREEIAEHKNEILHRANLDLEGVDSTYYDTTTAKKKLVNNDLQRAVFSSTYTFEQFLKFFGKHSANGEGRLYNYFHKLNQDALDEEQLYNEMNRNALDEKTKELFGKKKFMKLVGIDGKGMKEMDIEVTDYSNKKTGKRTIHLKQGQMLYIYLVNKETDGEMKLRAMGITEEDVAAIEENLDPRVKAMGEWLQDEYLPECQRRYQATHTKYFGAPMKEVENYFPLAINNRARNVKEDVNQDSDAMSQLAGTSTGAIVTRRVNVIPLDIENADAFEVAFNHLQEMEEWSAMLPFRQDINTLLSYTHFRNQVQNMSSVAYGSGKTLWDEFKQTAQIAAGTYKPKVNAGMMDSRIAAAMGGIAVAKISGRLWTAIKQSQSATVFLPECDFTRFVKNGVNPYGSWKWAKENIPDFRKRVENMTYGDVKLRQYLDELEKYHDWAKVISKWGMAPNILVDGITCAVGARSVYETEVNRLTKLGYPKEKAEEKAYYKAVAAYNKTQQSSGGMYLSPMQVDRTYVSAALSLFKNANYAYGRMQIEACRGLARTYDLWGGKHKTALIESMTRQIMEEDGLDENTARAVAKATYNRTFRQSIGRLINFATLVPVSWALYKALPYLLTGDDDDKKKDMIEEAVLKGFATSLSDNYVIPFASNILNAGLKVEDGKPTFDPEVFRYQNLYINPATSDLANIYSMVGNQKWYSVANKLGMLGVQSLIGFNPETVGALYQALSEADYDNGNTAKEWQIGILKAISAPEESIRELYMDELGLKSGDIKKIPLAELEKRYAERQINRDNLLSQIGMDAETFNGYVDKYQQSFEKKIKDKMDKWDEYDKKKVDEFFDTTSDPKLKDMIAKKRTKDANAAANEQIAKEGLNQEKKGKEPSEEAYDAVKMSIDVAEDNAISTYNKVLNKRYAALNDEYNEQTDAMKYIFMSKHPNFKAYKELESEYTNYGKKIKELKEKLVSADGYDAKQTILKQIRAEREKFSELQSKVR